MELTFATAVLASENQGEQKEGVAVSSLSATGTLEVDFVEAFHSGESWAVEKAYRDHGARVIAAARGLVGSVDAETIAHEVFYRLLANEKMRESFRGGNLGAWLCQVAVRSAVDDLRRRRREATRKEDEESRGPAAGAIEIDEELEAKILIERFRSEVLPAEFDALFDARFLRQLPQRDAARELGVPRSTLVYQEQKIRDLLSGFLLEERNA